MLTVETIRKIRLSIHRDGKSIRQTAKELRVSRNTVRKAVRSQQTVFTYRRSSQPRPALGAFVERLEKVLAKVAHLRLCHSRHFPVVAYPRETQEMVFDAHMRAFEFFGGVCRRRGIYDNSERKPASTFRAARVGYFRQKRGGPKGGGERATSHQKRTVNRNSRGG